MNAQSYEECTARIWELIEEIERLQERPYAKGHKKQAKLAAKELNHLRKKLDDY